MDQMHILEFTLNLLLLITQSNSQRQCIFTALKESSRSQADSDRFTREIRCCSDYTCGEFNESQVLDSSWFNSPVSNCAFNIYCENGNVPLHINLRSFYNGNYQSPIVRGGIVNFNVGSSIEVTILTISTGFSLNFNYGSHHTDYMAHRFFSKLRNCYKSKRNGGSQSATVFRQQLLLKQSFILTQEIIS
ncbi:hypothetical protein ACJMK2_033034 [Sinanodonta woodiana]|uniref:Uncharacterized protein n=1 Tax=Sinanodonta woodiana TaxID=1069815 RepID=A0ABD3X7L1_SINWO